MLFQDTVDTHAQAHMHVCTHTAPQTPSSGRPAMGPFHCSHPLPFSYFPELLIPTQSSFYTTSLKV